MKVLNRPMFRYGGPIKEGIMSGIKEPRRQGYAQPPGFVIQNDPNKMIVDRSLKNAEAFMKAGQVYDQDLNNQAFTLSAPNKVNQVSAFDKMKKNTQFGNQNPFVQPDTTMSKQEKLEEAYKPNPTNPFRGLIDYTSEVNTYTDSEGNKRSRNTGENIRDTDISEVITEPRGGGADMSKIPATKPDVKLSGDKDDTPPPPTKKERVNTILESLGYDRAQKNALYDAMIKAGQRISRTGLGAENLVSDVIAETSQSYDKPEKLREAANLMQAQQDLKLEQIEASKTNSTEEQVDFLMSAKGGNKSQTEALDIVLKNPRTDDEAYDKAYAQNKDSGRAVIAAVNFAVERDQYDKPLGIIDIKKYDNDPKKFFQDKDVYKGPGNYILGGSVIKIDEQGNATPIKKYYSSKKNEGFLAKFGFGGD